MTTGSDMNTNTDIESSNNGAVNNRPIKNIPMKIAVVIPAHNEAETIVQCLASVQTAIEQLSKFIEATVIKNTSIKAISIKATFIEASPLVVLDSCTDETLALVKVTGVDYLVCDYQCVGRVRDLGIRHAIDQGATWLACTDADSIVAPDWLWQQIRHIQQQPTDMICGVVSIDNWAHLTSKTQEDYIAHYNDDMGHHHIHGANLSFSSDAYLSVDGFAPLPCHEDIDLVSKFEAQGCAITWSNRVRVTTSSRLDARASGGFGGFLLKLEQDNMPSSRNQ